MSDTKILIGLIIFISVTGLLIYGINQLVSDPVEYEHSLNPTKLETTSTNAWWDIFGVFHAINESSIMNLYKLFTFQINGVPQTLSIVLTFLIYTPLSVILVIIGLNYVRGT